MKEFVSYRFGAVLPASLMVFGGMLFGPALAWTALTAMSAVVLSVLIADRRARPALATTGVRR